MKKGDTVLFQISKVQTCEGDIVQAEIVGDDGEHIRLSMSLHDYARIITGEAHIPVTVSRYREGQR